MKYKAIGVYKSGPLVNGYSLLDDEDKTLKVKLSDFTELVKAGLVSNFKHIKIGDIDYNIPKNSLASQLVAVGKEEYRIKDRVFSTEGSVAGYIVTTDNEDSLKISIKKAWELAFNECIVNATAYYREENGIIEKLIILDE